MWILQERVKIN